ncbi:hypothetical protein BGZ97_009457 [Linnemannia gamsii]|uniref:Uncharacterized protein n=1 Tax=Linnemannia gamsii TaxID=64522 RepID=A0A9P6R9R5_9FUNG|nr:hypothetical protein BGZ97_009457 [Linnemannia gamsii]
MSHAPNSTAHDIDINIYATLRLMQEQMLQQKPGFRQLEAESIEQDGGLVYKNPRATLSKLRQDVPDFYPVIGEPKFFDAGLHKTHDVFKWNDYHYTEVLLAGIRLATINGGYEKAKNIQVVVLGYDLMDFLDDVVGNVVPGLCYSVVIEGIIGILYA